ncbi:MAG: flagellar motor switch protein FliG [Gemmatimonadetes bacterium]|nr:flagellar motor switch protein FliG [Gemmatimonadota bacterium]
MPDASPAATAEGLSGPQKTAILCMLLGKEAASMILAHLSQEELELISYEIAQSGPIDPNVARIVLDEWESSSAVASELGGIDYARELLGQTVSADAASELVDRVRDRLDDQGAFASVRNADPRQIAGSLRDEHPQTIALILSQIDADESAEVIDRLEPTVSADVLYRLATSGRVSAKTIELVETAYEAGVQLQSSTDLTTAGGFDAAAALVKQLSGEKEHKLLGKVAERDPDVSERIRSLTFVFEDLLGLDDRSLQRLLREVDTQELALSLKAASESVSKRLRNNMSQRAVAALDEAQDFLGPVRVSEVEEAQGRILKEVQALEAAGEIMMGSGGDDPILE